MYKSCAQVTLRENHLAFQRIWLRPRVLVNVEKIDMRTTLLGSPSSFPVYITATALGKLAHPEVPFPRVYFVSRLFLSPLSLVCVCACVCEYRKIER